MRFYTFYHPYVCGLLSKLRLGGLEDMYGKKGYLRPSHWQELGDRFESFEERYNPAPHSIEETHKAEETLDFSAKGAYSIYNWEIFFHIPLHIAQMLTQTGRFEEAQHWLHRVFDPTAMPGEAESLLDPKRARYWKIFPFYREALQTPTTIAELLEQLNRGESDLREDIGAWRTDPFNPHLLARMRISSYMRKSVLQYLDNLIQWGDHLFQRHTIESITEASQVYILAKEILGARPVLITDNRPERNQSFAELTGDYGPGLDAFSNAWAEDFVEMSAAGSGGGTSGAAAGASLSNTLFFCIPGNQDLLKYWDTVDDRLFKIRHCQDVSGRLRALPLFEPPIDPALLVRARAAGLDIGSLLDDLSGSKPPLYRYQIMIQKALEMCNEVRGFGAAVLAAIEKKDAEKLAQIRSANEVNLLELQVSLIEQRIEEAKLQLKASEKTKQNAELRRDTYQNREYKNSYENVAQRHLKDAERSENLSSGFSLAAALAAVIPQFHAQSLATGTSIGGQQASSVLRAYAEEASFIVRISSRKSSQSLTEANYTRRQEDWNLQRDLAEIEIEQTEHLIIAAEIRIALAENEKRNLQTQIEQSKQVDIFLRDKFTNQALYTWMSGQLMALHRQAYELALNLAKRAERAAERELCLDVRTLNHVNSGHWDSQNKGLLAGDRLSLQLRRLESDFMERNIRKLELTKSISLALLNPSQLFQLRLEGTCEILLPKWLFDLDFPQHANRRIKNVRLSIPAVTGPYTTLAVELTHVASGETIATSNGQNDGGLFELNFRDERFLPFEGKDADNSAWRLNLPGLANFNRSTISDVIMHMSYTALPDSESSTEGPPVPPAGTNLFSVLSVQRFFPKAWELLQSASDTGTLEVEVTTQHLPYMVRDDWSISLSELVLETKSGERRPDSTSAVPLTGSNPWSLSISIDEPTLLKDIVLLIQARPILNS